MKIECCICWEKIVNGRCDVVSTVCGHIFHNECMTQWLRATTAPTCPQCRRQVNRSDLRKIFLNNVSSRNSDIFNSSIVMNLRDVQEDLCIMQTNLERENEQLKMENQQLVAANEKLDAEKQFLEWENGGLKAENQRMTEKYSTRKITRSNSTARVKNEKP